LFKVLITLSQAIWQLSPALTAVLIFIVCCSPFRFNPDSRFVGITLDIQPCLDLGVAGAAPAALGELLDGGAPVVQGDMSIGSGFDLGFNFHLFGLLSSG
jgi:hypothetical protein